MITGKIQISIDSTNSEKGYFQASTKVIWSAPQEKEKKEKKNPSKKMPEIVEYTQDDWGKNGINDENDSSFLVSSPEGLVLIVNMHSKELLKKLKNTPDQFIEREKTLWKMACLLMWVPFCSDEDADLGKVQKVLNKSIIGMFPLADVVKTMYINN